MSGATPSANSRASKNTSREFFAAHGWRLADDVAFNERGEQVPVFTLFKDDEDGNPVFMYTPLGRSGMDWPEVREHHLKMAEVGWARYQGSQCG